MSPRKALTVVVKRHHGMHSTGTKHYGGWEFHVSYDTGPMTSFGVTAWGRGSPNIEMASYSVAFTKLHPTHGQYLAQIGRKNKPGVEYTIANDWVEQYDLTRATHRKLFAEFILTCHAENLEPIKNVLAQLTADGLDINEEAEAFAASLPAPVAAPNKNPLWGSW